MNRLLLSFIILTFSLSVKAQERGGGGQLTYKCLGSDLYEVNLIAYANCGINLTAPELKVYNSSNTFLQSKTMTLRSFDTIDIIFNYPCTDIPANLCINAYTYIDTFLLPPLAGGYQLYYTNPDFRDTAIENIDLSVINRAGSALYTTIPDTSLAICNSSPSFQNDPPIAVCMNQPFSYDHSAIESDGDSLAYKLCTPYNNKNNPPTIYIPYVAGYSATSPLDANPPVILDSQTGLLTFTPTKEGLFAVAICVEEYRNGSLINFISRDFVFNVADCPPLTQADFVADIHACNKSVDLFNNSTGNIFFWNLGDNNSIQDTFYSITDTFYAYQDTGSYIITLIIDPGTPCSDTAFDTITLIEQADTLSYEICNGDIVQLNAFVSGADFYDWYNNDTNPTINTTIGGTFLANISLDSLCIIQSHVVEDCNPPVTPNAFSPNGDGLNDLFKVSKLGQTAEMGLAIYDRWGKKVFETNNLANGWDGNYEGKPLEQGVYIYRVYPAGVNIPFETGSVTLLR